MPTLSELNAKADELQSALDAEQEQIRTAIDGLNGTIATLQGQVADGGTAEERQAVLDKLNAIKTDLEGTINTEAPENNGGTGDGGPSIPADGPGGGTV